MIDNTRDLMARANAMQNAQPQPPRNVQWLPQMNIQLNAPAAPEEVQRRAAPMGIEANIRDMLRKLRQQPTPAGAAPNPPPAAEERSVLVPR